MPWPKEKTWRDSFVLRDLEPSPPAMRKAATTPRVGCWYDGMDVAMMSFATVAPDVAYDSLSIHSRRQKAVLARYEWVPNRVGFLGSPGDFYDSFVR